MESKKNRGFVGCCYRTFCVILFNKKNLKRDIAILGSFILILLMLWTVDANEVAKRENSSNKFEAKKVLGEENVPKTENEIVKKEEELVAESVEKLDTASWIRYQNTWFGFVLKYPDSWNEPIVRKAVPGAFWEQKVEFRAKQIKEEDPFEGFDMVIYPLSRVKNSGDMDEFPKLQNEELRMEEDCKTIDGHLLETGDYPAEEIYVPTEDACYEATLYFTNTRSQYVYNLVPKFKEGWGLAGDPAEEIKSHMPEFFAAASTMELIDMVRPKPIVVKPKIIAPMPYAYKTVNGRRVCSVKNDHPSKSDKHKGKHMDMECCLDPDEYPNPNCYYDPIKYGKYLK